MPRIEQQRFFQGLGFKRRILTYPCGVSEGFESPKGHFYRVDHFDDVYVIEFAENEAEAKKNLFEDADLFQDDRPEEALIKTIQASLRSYDE